MGLIKDTGYNYYGGSQSFLGDGTTINFNIVLTPQPKLQKEIIVFINGELVNESRYSYADNVLTVGQYQLDEQGNIIYDEETELPVSAYLLNSEGEVVLDDEGNPVLDPKKLILQEFDQLVVTLVNKQHGNYRYTSLADLVNNFMVSYVGDGKIINRAKEEMYFFTLKEQCKNLLLI